MAVVRMGVGQGGSRESGRLCATRSEKMNRFFPANAQET